MDLASLGKKPISEAQPTGSDVRYEPEFEQLQVEIDKMSNPAASGGTDWKKVSELASGILANKSKDLLVASYLAVAQTHTNQIEGFAVGLGVYRDLLELFWEGLFPTKKRMRGRVAAIEWWLEKSEAAFQALKVDPLPPEKIDQFRQNCRQIDKLLREYLEEAPLLRPLERFIDSIPIKAEKKAQTEAPPASAQVSEAGPVSAPKPAPPKPGAPAETAQIASSSDVDKVLRGALQTMRRAADYFQKDNLSNPQGYRWRRIAGWSMIQALPPATNGKTQIPPPLQHDTVRSNLNGLKEKGNWEALVRTGEELFQGALLWLDLNRHVAEGLVGLGDKYQAAHDAVCQETGYLVYRLGGVETLTFVDGTPFGDTETQQWLKGIRFGAGTAMAEPVVTAGAETADRVGETIAKAVALVKKKKVGEAVTILQQELRTSFSRRDQLLWRLGLAQILLDAKRLQLALPHLESVLEDIDSYKLEEWDPSLALKGLKLVWLGFSTRSDEIGKGQATAVLNRIVRLDPAEALLFTKG
jgi:type VI secretion system protein VasJ